MTHTMCHLGNSHHFASRLDIFSFLFGFRGMLVTRRNMIDVT